MSQNDALVEVPKSVNLILYPHMYANRFPDDDFSLLLVQRDANARDWPGTYSIPGGHLQDGESAFETAVRRMAEEMKCRSTGKGLCLDAKTFRYLGQYHPTDLGFSLFGTFSDTEREKGWAWTLAKWAKVRYAIAAPLPEEFHVEDYALTAGERLQFFTRRQIQEAGQCGRIFPIDKPYLLTILNIRA